MIGPLLEGLIGVLVLLGVLSAGVSAVMLGLGIAWLGLVRRGAGGA